MVEMNTGYKHCCKAALPTVLLHKEEFLRHFIDFPNLCIVFEEKKKEKKSGISEGTISYFILFLESRAEKRRQLPELCISFSTYGIKR